LSKTAQELKDLFLPDSKSGANKKSVKISVTQWMVSATGRFGSKQHGQFGIRRWLGGGIPWQLRPAIR
jgi:hypothetical protein